VGGGDGREEAGGEGSNGTEVPVSCKALGDLESYRYTVSVETHPAAKLNPTTEGSLDPSSSTAAPPDELSEALSRLLSDFSIRGAHVSPDRFQAILELQDQELELRTIGGQSWLRVGETWQEEDAPERHLLTPLVVCEEIAKAIPASLLEGEPEKSALGSIPATRYHLAQSGAESLAPLLGVVDGLYAIDLWLADDGNWPAQLLIQ